MLKQKDNKESLKTTVLKLKAARRALDRILNERLLDVMADRRVLAHAASILDGHIDRPLRCNLREKKGDYDDE